MFVTFYWGPGTYTEFLSEFSEFLKGLDVKKNKVIIVGDVNNHVDVENDSLGTAFLSQLESFSFCQCVQESTHTFNHTLDHWNWALEGLLKNQLLSYDYHLMFEFLLISY